MTFCAIKFLFSASQIIHVSSVVSILPGAPMSQLDYADPFTGTETFQTSFMVPEGKYLYYAGERIKFAETQNGYRESVYWGKCDERH